MKAFVEEDGSAFLDELLREREPRATSRISYVECHAAFARGKREGRLSAKDVSALVRDLRRRWEDLVILEFDAPLGERAASLAHELELRAADAIQLASASELMTVLGGVRFACWDRRLRQAAASLGFHVVPEVLEV